VYLKRWRSFYFRNVTFLHKVVIITTSLAFLNGFIHLWTRLYRSLLTGREMGRRIIISLGIFIVICFRAYLCVTTIYVRITIKHVMLYNLCEIAKDYKVNIPIMIIEFPFQLLKACT